MEADNVGAIATSVIAFVTVIGVITTIAYYFIEILGMKIPIIILMSALYIVAVGLFVRYVKGKLK